MSASPGSDPTKPATRMASKSRVLACVLCQQRKIKCDRRFPCINCTKTNAQCVPGAQTRNRKPRFPERALLDRIRGYEELLRQNNVRFEPLAKDMIADRHSVESDAVGDEASEVGDAQSSTVESEKTHVPKDFWQAITQESVDACESGDDIGETTFRNAMDLTFATENELLPGHKTVAELSTVHPGAVQIFQLWQIYLDNVNPLLKVTHTPSLQGRIIQAATDPSDIPPAMEALMFGIYCMAVTSLDAVGCQALFGVAKERLLTKYQFGCQQALANAGYLRTMDRDCLTALLLYLISIRPRAHPRTLASISSIAIHIAKRMGIHSEAVLARSTTFEAEMGRRLWWPLMLFDARVNELASSKDTILTPTWDCKPPLNVNDTDLRPEMKQPPVEGRTAEALFAVVRSELAEFTRHAEFHLDFVTPTLKAAAKGRSLGSFERLMEEKYLRFCDADIPLHFVTLWSTRAYLFRCRLIEYFSKYSGSSLLQTDAIRDKAIVYACGLLECDTKLTSPLAKGYLWLINMHFPAPAYIQILQDFRRRPNSRHAPRAWAALSNHYTQRHVFAPTDDSPLFRIFRRMILLAWEARQGADGLREEIATPEIVSRVRGADAEAREDDSDMALDGSALAMPLDLGDAGPTQGTGGHGYSMIPGIVLDAPFPLDGGHLDWVAADWFSAESCSWQGT